MKLLDFLLSYPCGTIYMFWFAEDEKGLSSLLGDKSIQEFILFTNVIVIQKRTGCCF